jgi:hypothetical protein
MPRQAVGNSNPFLSNKILRRLAIIDAFGLIGCVVSRAPTLMDKLKIPVVDVTLSVNAGYLVIFGPGLLFLAVVWIAYAVRHRSPSEAVGYSDDLMLPGITFALPALTAAFLALQFFLLLAPPGECPTFARWRYLFDFSIREFKPEYCMGTDAATQAHIPWLMTPVIAQAWGQVIFPLATAVLSVQAFRLWRMKARTYLRA